MAVAMLALSMALGSTVPTYAAGGITGNLSLRVVDAAGNPIADAKVTLASPSGTYRQSSDSKGNVYFFQVSVDTYVLSVEAPGYHPIGREGLTIQGDVSLELGNVTLEKESLRTIGRVSARSASSAFNPSATVPQYSVSGSVLEAAQGKTASASETDVLLAAPGFQIDKMGNLILEGSTTDEVHFFFDGVDFTDPGFNRNGNNYFFNGVSSTQIVPGAGDPSQGDSGAGSVNLVVKRGTYPGTGLVDVEALSRPFDHQFNLEYGAATSNNSVSDFFSFFKLDANSQIGAFGSPALDNNAFYNDTNYTAEEDFVNNFVVRFGKNQNQSLQALYYTNATALSQDYAGVTIPYDNQLTSATPGIVAENPYGFPDTGFYNATACTALPCNAPGQFSSPSYTPASLAASLIKNEQGEYPGGVATQPDNISTTTLLKFEYDNQLNATTALNLRYFNANYFNVSDEVALEENFPNPYPLAGQTAGGSRTGGILQIQKQADSHNLLTLSANVEDARPNFGSVFSPIGVESLGPNADIFLRPANPNAPVSATNPCPINASAPGGEFAGACFLQQYYYNQGGTPLPPDQDLDSKNLQHFYGAGLRDQVQLNPRLRLDLGVRLDYIDEGFGNNLFYEDEDVQPVPGSPGTYYVANYGNVEKPHFIEPRVGFAYQPTNNDSVAFTYGKSVNETGSGEQASPNAFDQYAQFQNMTLNTPSGPTALGAALTNLWTPASGTFGPTLTPQSCYPTIPYPVGATSASQPSYKGSVGTTLQLGKPCANLAQLLYFQGDAYYPEVAAVIPAIFENYDFNYSHQFKNGSAVRIAPFLRQGKDIQVATAPLIFNPATGLYTFGSLVNQPGGRNTTTGLSIQYTLPEHPVGWTGFLSATYVNEFTNTPPAGDNPYSTDFEPYVLPQSYATGDLYRAGFVSPVVVNIGAQYKMRSGFRINPVVHFNIGYPYNAGSLTPYFSPLYGPENVPNTNFTDQFGAVGAPKFVDFANPGSLNSPVIAASRGTAETPSGGGLLSRPQLYSDITFEYTPPHSRSTVGLVVQDLFNNEYFGVPSPNTNYYPVSTGVAGPETGQNFEGLAFPGYANVVAKDTNPYGAYTVPFGSGIPLNLRLYFQYKL
jgi:hypothetical protein